MKKSTITLGLLAFLIMCLSTTLLAEGEQATADLSQFLSDKGILDLNAAIESGYQGSINIEGYSIRFDPETGAPILRDKSAQSDPQDVYWLEGLKHLPSIDGVVNDIAIFNNSLCIGGNDFIYRWTGATWESFSSSPNDSVLALCVFDNELIAAGAFTSIGGVLVNHIAAWDGSSWASLGTGLDSVAYALTVYNGKLIAGGRFDQAGGVSALKVASWDGSSWSAITGSGNYISDATGVVKAFQVYNNRLYIGGTFFKTNSTSNITAWDSSTNTYYNIGGTIGEVTTFTVFDNSLIMGGSITYTYSGGTCHGVAKYDGGGAWTALGTSSDVRDLGVFNGSLYQIDYQLLVRRWNVNNSTWETVGQDSRFRDGKLAVFEDKLIIAGTYMIDAGHSDYRVYDYDGTTCSTGPGIDGTIRAMAIYNGHVIAGGDFLMSNHTTLHYIADWDGTQWATMNAGFLDTVRAIVVCNNTLYAGGDFGVSEWTGSAWASIGSISSTIYALGNDIGGNLVAGGAGYIAKWNGMAWQAMSGGPGVNDTVFALNTFDGRLYVGGTFSSPGNNIAYYINSWSSIGSGTNGPVYAIADFDNKLVVGGSFTTAGGNTASNIASWDDSNWSPIGASIDFDGAIRSLNTFDEKLIAGGDFTDIEGASISHIAAWDTVSGAWEAMGSGVDDQVYSLLNNNDLILCAGGEFINAGDKISPYFAQWTWHEYGIICGDANSDGSVNIGDATYIMNYAFQGGPPPNPVCKGDANGDGFVNSGDAVYIVNYAFRGGPAPVAGCCD